MEITDIVAKIFYNISGYFQRPNFDVFDIRVSIFNQVLLEANIF